MIFMSMPGGWTVYDAVSEEEMKIFNAAMKGLVGVDYKPEIVATQIVNGTNQCFICKTTIVVPDSPEGISKVMIYQPLHGDPVVTSIEKLI